MIRLRRLLAAVVLALVASVPLAAPASARAGGTVEANVFLRDLTLPAGGPTVGEDLSFFLSADRPGWAREVTLTVDLSGVTGVADATVEPDGPEITCATTGTLVRCTVPGPHRVIVVPDSGRFAIISGPGVRVRLTPKPGATPGDTGALTVSASADGGPAATRTSRVRIGEGVNLTAVDARDRRLAPGGSIALRPQVHNSGSRDADGVTLVVAGDALVGTNFGNCVYAGSTVCTFDTTLTAGRTYRTSRPFTVRVPRDAMAGSSAATDLQWLTAAEWEDLGDADGRHGTGPDLRLVEVASAAAARVPQADVDGDDNGSHHSVTVSGGRRADIAAVGATVGPPGTTRTIEVGLANRGPGTLRYPPFANNLPYALVTLPAGLSVVRADRRCETLGGEDPDGPPPSAAAEAYGAAPPAYLCTTGTIAVRAGHRLTFSFTVTSHRAARGAVGAVEAALYGAGVDRTPGNNSAPIRVAAGGAAGGGLAVTGTTAATVAGFGLLLVVLGTAVTTTLRRRR